MSRPSSRRSRWFAISLLALSGALLLPATASAAKETFHRFEVEGTANYTITEDCADGSTAQTRVTVIGGHEEESEEGVTTLDSDFLTVLIRGFDCDFNLINDRGSGPAEFTFSSGLERASVTGTIELSVPVKVTRPPPAGSVTSSPMPAPFALNSSSGPLVTKPRPASSACIHDCQVNGWSPTWK